MTETPTGRTGGEHSASSGAGRLGDRYEIGGLLGRGGMADVRVGRDLRLGRTVAIKRLRTDLASDPTFLARFRREAQSAAALNHPAIVAVYDTGEAPGPDGQTVPYIVMEYVEGQTLRELTQEGRKIMPQRSLEMTADILNALDYSHRAGIVHRDIKPGNVMLTPAGQVKVMDFGIARAIADSSSAMTQTAAVVGTAQYLSPEQARGEQVDARSDIYSTGCLLYELLTGRPPFVGDSPVSVAYQHVREEAPAPSTLNPEITPAMDTIVAKALAKRTEDRYQSAADMRADIERAVAGLEIAGPATSVVPGLGNDNDATAVGTAVPAASSDPDDNDEKKSRRGVWIAVVLAVLLLIGVAAYAIPKLMADDAPPPPAMVAVPDVSGRSPDAATRTLEAEELQVGQSLKQASADVPEGDVIGTDPAADEEVEEGATVDLLVSTGPKKVTIPYVQGKQASDARQELEKLGLEVEIQRRDNDARRNQVLSSAPVFSTEVEPGSTVTLEVSNGQTEVPDVVGKTEREAKKQLDGESLRVKTVKDPSATEPKGTVTDQTPGAGDQVPPGATIVITVSDKPDATTPPPTTPPPTTPPTTPPPDANGDGAPDVP